MRALLLGLIMANVLYWTWSGNVDTVPVKPARALDPGLPLLQLVPRASPPDIAADNTEPGQISRSDSDDGPSIDEGDAAEADTETTVEVPAVQDESSPASATTAPSDNVDSLPARPVVNVPDTSPGVNNLLASVDPATNPARCVGVGPFTSLREASEVAARLNEAGLTVSQRVEESQVWVGHWVHLPSYSTRQEAIVVVERLRKQGVKDIYIEPSGELKNTISLGLFTELERAEIRAGSVKKLGDVSPQIRDRSRDGLVYWIDLALGAGVELDKSALPHNTPGELRVEPVDCPPDSANS